jgi:hypothetical protein
MVNQELVDYLKNGVSQGHTLDTLKQHLVTSGYQQSDVDEAAGSVSQGAPVSQGQVNMPKEIKVISILFFAMAGLALLVGILSGLLLGLASTYQPNALILAGFYFFLGLIGSAFYFVAGYGLWKMKNWGRILAVLLAILMIPSFVGIIPAGFLLYFLLRKETVSAFVK